MNKIFKCPKCGAFNKQYYCNCLGEEDYGDKIWKKYYGYCRACDTTLVWTEEYKFKGYAEREIRKD